MVLKETSIQGLKIIEPRVFEDQRGYFFESYNEKAFKEHGLPTRFVQDNQSLSQKGALRGLHFQAPPFAQGKLVRVITGSVLDIVVDIRKGSPSYGEHFSIVLNDQNKTMFWIPTGFAHGFLTLEDNTIFSYKCSELYSKEHESGIYWNDPELLLPWGQGEKIISEKDNNLGLFATLESPFNFIEND